MGTRSSGGFPFATSGANSVEEEITWIQNILAGKTRDFKKLYAKHHQRLYSLCYRFTGNAADAEEALQEIFMRLLDKLASFRADASFAAWARRVAVNYLINQRRANQTETVELQQDEAVDATSEPSLAMALDQAVASLPEGFRKVFILHDREGYRHEEIAEIIGCSPATSRSQLCRARLALRDLLKPRLTQEVLP